MENFLVWLQTNYITIIFCVIISIIGFLSQKIEKLNFLSFFIYFVGSVLVLIASNDTFLTVIEEKFKFPKFNTVLIISLFYVSSSISLYIFKIVTYNKIKKKLVYSDYVINEKIQKEMNDIYEQIKGNTVILGDKFFVSVFFVHGKFFRKIKRVGYFGYTQKEISDWNGEIKKISKTTTGKCCKSKKVEIVTFKENDLQNNIKGLPVGLQMWTKENLSHRIIIPVTDKFCILKKEFIFTQMIYAINCINGDLKMDDKQELSHEESNEMNKIMRVLQLKKKTLLNFYSYFN